LLAQLGESGFVLSCISCSVDASNIGTTLGHFDVHNYPSAMTSNMCSRTWRWPHWAETRSSEEDYELWVCKNDCWISTRITFKFYTSILKAGNKSTNADGAFREFLILGTPLRQIDTTGQTVSYGRTEYQQHP
jgi:hypothetical protein